MSLKHNDASKRRLYLMVSWKTPVSGNIYMRKLPPLITEEVLIHCKY